MKTNYTVLALIGYLFCGYAIVASADSTYKETPGVGVDLVRSGTIIQRSIPTIPDCWKLADADVERLKNPKGVTYACDPQATKRIYTWKVPVPPPPPVVWTKFADEGVRFFLKTKAVVRYGTDAKYTDKELAAGDNACGNEQFVSTALPSGDPDFGKRKDCRVKDIAVIGPVTPPDVTPPTEPDPGMPMPPGLIPIPSPEHTVGFTTLRVRPTAGEPPAVPSDDGTGAFRNPCGYSHMAFDDPIVFPGQHGASHLHTFFGNTSTNAFSTTESLFAAGSSTCAGGIANLSAYWVPALIDTVTNKALVPYENLVYYKNGYNQIPNASVRAPPNGLRFIGGNLPTETGPIDKNWVHHSFLCNGVYVDNAQSIPACPAGGFLQVSIGFPNCWDGVNYDSPNHRSHMAYAGGGACPASHPIAIPSVAMNMKYHIEAGQDVTKWRLSSDMYDKSLPGGYSMHGDLWFNWQPDIADAWTNNCVRRSYDCHGFLLGDGRTTY
jgi:hypothetical protein